MSDVPRFGETAARLVAQGYSPVPLVYGEKRPSVRKNWQHYKFASKDIVGGLSYKMHGTGILCGEVVALDIDVRDAKLTAEIEALAERELGQAPRRIGAAPKVLRIYRTDAPFSKITSRETALPGDAPNARKHRVEVLGVGQQFVAFNQHPDTGKPYVWNGAGDPLTVKAAELVTVTEKQMRKFVVQVNALLPNATDDVPPARPKNSEPINRAECRAMLAAIPNDDSDYDHYIKIGHAIAGALGADGEHDWYGWAGKSGKFDATKSEADWRGFMRLHAQGKLRSGVGTIIYEAKKHGWHKQEREFAIEIKAGERARVLTQLTEMMPAIAQRGDLMVYGGQLVHPFTTPRPGFDGKIVEVLELNTLTSVSLASYIDAHVDFTGWRSARGVMRKVPEDCPGWLMNTYMDRADLLIKLPQATGLATTPVWRDGELISVRGFDSKSSKWVLAPPGVNLPARLSRKSALDALGLLRELLSEFRFNDTQKDQRNQACAVALILTAAMRASLPHAPLFVVTKHEHGEGGSTLCTLASVIQTGRRPAVITVAAESSADAEIEKRIDAAQLAGASNIVLDNYKTGGVINSTSLATIITEAERDVRILGLSKNVRCPNSQLVLVNGRNVTIAEDFIRRAVRIEIDTKMATPDERKFKHPDLLNEAVRDRAAILSACFTIVAAYDHYVGGHKRVKVTNRAGFESWARHIAEPLAWLGLADVSLIPATQRAVDPERALIARLLPAWQDLCAEMSATTTGITAQQTLVASPTLACSGFIVDVLAEATNAKLIAGTPQLLPKQVSAFLRRIAGRVVGGRRLMSVGTTGGVARWAVQTLEES